MHFTCRTRRLANASGQMGNFTPLGLRKLNSMGSWCTELSDYMAGLVSEEFEFHGWLGKKKVLSPPSPPPRCFFLE